VRGVHTHAFSASEHGVFEDAVFDRRFVSATPIAKPVQRVAGQCAIEGAITAPAP
jgi:hypothetical protein